MKALDPLAFLVNSIKKNSDEGILSECEISRKNALRLFECQKEERIETLQRQSMPLTEVMFWRLFRLSIYLF